MTRQLEALDSFEITGRGRVYVVDDPDPVVEMGETIEVGGKVGKVIAIESYRIAGGRKPGHKIGVVIEET